MKTTNDSRAGRVLAVDDNDVVLKMLTVVLSQQGLEVQTSNSSLGLVQIVKEFAPDVIILDVSFLTLGGDRALALLRERDPYAPLVVYFSSRDARELETMAPPGSASGFITKGRLGSDFAREVVKWVDRSRRRKPQSTPEVFHSDTALVCGPAMLTAAATRDLVAEVTHVNCVSSVSELAAAREGGDIRVALIYEKRHQQAHQWVLAVRKAFGTSLPIAVLCGNGRTWAAALRSVGADLVLALGAPTDEVCAMVCRMLRAAPRAPLRAITKLYSAAHDNQLFVVGHSRDISRTGASIDVQNVLALDAGLRLGFYLTPKYGECDLHGRVVRVAADTVGAAANIGVQFENADPSMLYRIDGYVREFLRP